MKGILGFILVVFSQNLCAMQGVVEESFVNTDLAREAADGKEIKELKRLLRELPCDDKQEHFDMLNGALIAAVRKSRYLGTKVLVKYGADPRVRIAHTDITALALAQEGEDKKMQACLKSLIKRAERRCAKR